LSVSKEDILAAVEKVGNSAATVRKELANARSVKSWATAGSFVLATGVPSCGLIRMRKVVKKTNGQHNPTA
jgi:hypothetical protein